jgi:hypothetical protein
MGMVLMGQLGGGTGNTPEQTVGILAILGLVVCGLWTLLAWLLRGPSSAEPWGEQISAEIAGDEATPLCHRCLSPHDPSADFCPDCGAAVGLYTNLLPYPYLFSLGHTLRIGTAGDFKHSALTISGFFLLSLADYPVLAPVYWGAFIWGLLRPRESDPPGEEPPKQPQSGGVQT